MNSFGGLLLFGTLVALANVVGGLLLARPNRATRDAQLLRYLVALGAGFMLAAIFIEIMPEVVRLWLGRRAVVEHAVLGATTLLLVGYLLIHRFEHTLAPHFHFGAETHTEAMLRPSAAYAAIGGFASPKFFYRV